jgi:hypothetical protein
VAPCAIEVDFAVAVVSQTLRWEDANLQLVFQLLYSVILHDVSGHSPMHFNHASQLPVPGRRHTYSRELGVGKTSHAPVEELHCELCAEAWPRPGPHH